MSTQDLDAEDTKLVVLARGAMARAEAGSGAAVRDADGRTYAGAPVTLNALSLTALQAAVAAAVSSGATGLEAAVLAGGSGDDARRSSKTLNPCPDIPRSAASNISRRHMKKPLSGSAISALQIMRARRVAAPLIRTRPLFQSPTPPPAT